MGNAASAGPRQSTSLTPVLFGAPGGPVLSAILLHQRQGDVRNSTVTIVTKSSINQYNAGTGDRRMRVKPKLESVQTSAWACDASSGPMALLGGPHGALLVHDALSLELRRGVPKAGKPSAITAIVATGPKTALAGFADGSTVEIILGSGARVRVFPAGTAGSGGVAKVQETATPPQPAKGFEAVVGVSVSVHPQPVCSIVRLDRAPKLPLVAVAHDDGRLRVYDGDTGHMLVEESLDLSTGCVLSLCYLPSIHALVGAEVACLASISGTGVSTIKAQSGGAPGQKVWLWDLAGPAAFSAGPGASLELDLSPEMLSLASVQGGSRTGNAVATTLCCDDALGLVMLGCSDGAVYVRRLRRVDRAPPEQDAESVSGGVGVELKLSLLRVVTPTAEGIAPGPVTSLCYERARDTLVVGDAVGYARVVRGATHVAEDEG